VDGKCDCTEEVQFLEFKGPVPGFRQVNAFEHAAGAQAKCSIANSNVIREAVRFDVSDRLISTAIFELEYCRTCGGSCHGHTVLATYDGRTGVSLRIGDVLKPGAVRALREHMADYVAKTTVDKDAEGPSGREFTRARLGALLAQRSLIDEGLYVENGTVFV